MKKRNALTTVSIALITVFLIGCDKEFSTIGSEVIGEGNYETKKATFDVIAYNRNLTNVRTDGLSHYQLGTYVHPFFGTTRASIVSQLSLSTINPRFGAYSATQELERYQENQASPDTHLVDDEEETVTAVYLHIPFFSNQIPDTDGDGAEDDIDPEPETFNVDADGDGVIAPLDSDDNDPNTDYDGDGVIDGDENENGTSPYYADSDGDGINDNEDTVVNCSNENFELDSIFGNREENFNITVSKVTDFIQSLDPGSNFENTKAYFSDDTFNVDPNPWFQGTYQISTTNYVIEKDSGIEDNEDTPEDESITCETFAPGIRIQLAETTVFQEFLDAEGSDELASNSNFSDYLRGVMIEADATDLMMFLNLNGASLSIDYSFQKIDNKNTPEDTSDDEVVTGESTFKINLSGKIINLFENEEYPTEVSFDEQNPENLYVKGGSGTYVELNLFDEDRAVLDTIPKNWLINEANLVFYLDEDDLSSYEEFKQPDRIYLYNLTNETTLVDYNFDFIGSSPTSQIKYPIFGGVLEDNNSGPKYKIRITEHINRIIRKDSTNAKLGLFVTNNILNVLNVTGNSVSEGELLIPQASITSPFGTVLHGANINVPENKRLKLEIYYTEP